LKDRWSPYLVWSSGVGLSREGKSSPPFSIMCPPAANAARKVRSIRRRDHKIINALARQGDLGIPDPPDANSECCAMTRESSTVARPNLNARSIGNIESIDG
jgi:hypothetical protein